MEYVVKNGTVVTAAGVMRADVGIEGEQITAIAQRLQGNRVIDATGQYVFPGFVDAHVHLQMAVGNIMTGDDFTSGTVAAACGGTTTVIDFTSNVRGDDLLKYTTARRTEANGHTVVDYSLRLTLADATERTLAQLPILAESGYASAKLYTTYEPIRLADGEILQLLAATCLWHHADGAHRKPRCHRLSDCQAPWPGQDGTTVPPAQPPTAGRSRSGKPRRGAGPTGGRAAVHCSSHLP
jgi:dihydropyrimidinase